MSSSPIESQSPSQHQQHSLVKMVNQIAANIQHQQSPELAAEQVANHLRRFWARSMKQAIMEYSQQDGAELSPLAREAIAKLSA